MNKAPVVLYLLPNKVNGDAQIAEYKHKTPQSVVLCATRPKST